MPNSELSKYVYAILDQGQVIIATLDEEEAQNRTDHRPTVTQLDTDHRYPAAMVFPATYENYEALQILYEDIPVPNIPLEPNDIVRELLTHHQTYVIAKYSTQSYTQARENIGIKVLEYDRLENRAFYVPYDVYGNEITSLDDVKGDTDEKQNFNDRTRSSDKHQRIISAMY